MNSRAVWSMDLNMCDWDRHTLSIIQFEGQCVRSLCFTEEYLYYGHNFHTLQKSVSFFYKYVFSSLE